MPEQPEDDGWRGDRATALARLEERVRAMIAQLNRMEMTEHEWRRNHEQNIEQRFRSHEDRFEKMDQRLDRYVSKEELAREFKPVGKTFDWAGDTLKTLVIMAIAGLIGWLWSQGP